MSLGTRFGGLSLLLLGLLGGCAGEVIESNSEQIQSYEQFLELYAQALCAPQQKCCSQDDFQPDPECVAKMSQSVRAEYGLGKEAEDPNAVPASLRFDPEMATQCIQALRAQSSSCSLQGQSYAKIPCRKAFQGTLSPGEPCNTYFECESKPPLYGRCEERAGPGSAKKCSQIWYINGGEECTGAAVQGYDNVKCEIGYSCSSTTGRCELWDIPGPGQPCSRGACMNSRCDAATHTCEALRYGGAPCASNWQCLSGSCTQNKCDPPPIKGENCKGSTAYCNCVGGICRTPDSVAIAPLCIVPN